MEFYIFSLQLLDALKNQGMKSLAYVEQNDFAIDRYIRPDVPFLYQASSKEVPLIGKEIDGNLYLSINSNEVEVIASNDIPLILNLLVADGALTKYLEQAGYDGILKKGQGKI